MTVTTLRVPSERDFEAYQQVAGEGKSTRAVAATLQISQTRVCQIVEQVLQWLGQVLPGAAERMPEEARLLVAQQVAVTRLENLYGEAMDAWRGSQADEQGSGRGRGNARYLAVASSIGAKLAKLPASLLPFVGLHSDSEKSIPPVGDCSAEASEQGAKAASGSGDVAVSDCCETTCDVSVERESELPLGALDPVQTLTARESFGQPTLNRHQRRARQKLLDQLRRKAK